MIKTLLDDYAKRYETVDFVKDDPVQFVHKFSGKNDIEIAGFIASVFAYGKREVFISKLNYIFEIPLIFSRTFLFILSITLKHLILKIII